MASAAYRKIFLRSLAWSSERTGESLQDGLKTAAKSAVRNTSEGSFLVGTSGNGASASFEIPRGIDPLAVAELCSNLLDLHDAAVATLAGDPTDSEILAEMIANIKPVRQFSADFTGLGR